MLLFFTYIKFSSVFFSEKYCSCKKHLNTTPINNFKLKNNEKTFKIFGFLSSKSVFFRHFSTMQALPFVKALKIQAGH